MTKHKHYDCIVAWAAGDKIEVSNNGEYFTEIASPSFDENMYYRIKKEPVIEVVYFQYEQHPLVGSRYVEFKPDMELWHLKITYQDGKAIKAELPE